LKADRQNYVCVGYHGFKSLTKEQRKNYSGLKGSTFKEKHFVHIDTMAMLINVVLYSHLVSLKSSHNSTNAIVPSLSPCSFERLYQDCKKAIDLCSSNDEIKNKVMSDPSSYIERDSGLPLLLSQLREAKKKTFLLTNSLFDYTSAIMNYLLLDKTARNSNHKSNSNNSNNNNKEENDNWTDFFDLIIVGANKPGFLKEDSNLTFFRVTESGELANIIGSDQKNRLLIEEKKKIFQGGCYKELHNLLSINSGDRVLYVGDHMYDDILRTRRSLGWRTCLIIPELEKELTIAKRETPLRERIALLMEKQLEQDEKIDALRSEGKMGKPEDEEERREEKVAEDGDLLREAEDEAIEVISFSFSSSLYSCSLTTFLSVEKRNFSAK
jgi:HAD superfamily 5'-nucleotidase-like hydrolase